MKLHLGKNLKQHRTACGMTQEALAEQLGVTPQTVSRWESCVSYPDIELLPSIANLFHITVDALIGSDELRQEYDLNDVFTEAICAEKAGAYDRAAEILRTALRLYPGHDGLMCELAMTLGQTGQPTDRTEAIMLSERILALSENDKVRSTAKAHLCLLYRDAGLTSQAETLCRTLPHIWESREAVMALLAENGDDTALAWAHSIASQVFDDLEHRRTIAFSAGYRGDTPPN